MEWRLLRLHWLIIVAAAATILLGPIGWYLAHQTPQGPGTPIDWLSVAYRTLALFNFDVSNLPQKGDNWALAVARFTGPVALIGAIVRVIMTVVTGAVARWRTDCCKNHVVICGLGRRGRAFALDRRAAGREVVAIEAQPSEADAEFCRLHGVHLLAGECRDSATLRAARVEQAKRLVIVTGDDNANLETAMRARGLVPRGGDGGRCLKVNVSINDPNLWHEVTQSRAVDSDDAQFDLMPFSLSTLAARKFFWEEPLYVYADLRGHARIHAVFLGL